MLSLGQALMDAAGVIFPALIEAIWAFFSNTDWLGLSLTVAQNLFDGFLTILPQAIDFIGNFVANVLDIFGFHGLAEQVRGIFEDVKSKITQPIEDAKNVVDSAISKIKGFFPISVGKILDNIKLPHFTVDGGEFPYGVGGMGRMPDFDVSWYAKGGIFDRANIIGIGEAGPEAVVPLSSDRMRPFARAIAEEMGGTGGTYTIVVPVEIDGREVARSTATFTRAELRRLDRIDSRKAGVAW